MDSSVEPPLAQASNKIHPPESWRKPETHLEHLLVSPWYGRVMRLLNEANAAANDFFISTGAGVAFAPITTSGVSSPMGLGSDSLPVQAAISGHSLYLADSMQFALELALRVTGRTAYYIMPSFRGESSDARHLNQFIHAEAELAGTLDDVMNYAEALVRHLTKCLINRVPQDIEDLGGDIRLLLEVADGPTFTRLQFAEAERILALVPGALEPVTKSSNRITSSGERVLLGTNANKPLWITHMPSETVPFYQAADPNDPSRSLTADLLLGIGETIGAGQRAYSGVDVLGNLRRAMVGPAEYDWYIKMKERAPMVSSGFGLGLERFMLWITQTDDIRNWCFLLRDEAGVGSP